MEQKAIDQKAIDQKQIMACKKPLLILTGPTSVGKTALSIALAKRVGGEIISADSMQVYRHMDIGSAKIKASEMQGVPHHMLDILEPSEPFHIMLFQKYAKQYIAEIQERGHLPILVGGTGFYIQSVLYDIDFTKETDDGAYREWLQRLGEEKGDAYLHEQLRAVDPKAAETIHQKNRKRVIRALEYHHLTGERISEHNETQHEKESAYQACYFVLNDVREQLYARIDERVEQMLRDGLVDEVRALMQRGCTREMTAMQGLGYKEIMDYLNGEISLERAIYLIKRDTRHFAKRQLTWFRREKDVIWINKDEFDYDNDKILTYMLEQMQQKDIEIVLPK